MISAEIESRLNSKNGDPSKGKFSTSDFYDRKNDLGENNNPLNSKIENEYYANLELPPGSSFEEIKKSYKNLMKKYHPDMFYEDDRSKFAEEITQKLNEAYNYFENKHKE